MTTFPGESKEYRAARDRLLEAEVELRRKLETVAEQRRALPPGGLVPEDYVFEEVARGGEVRFSDLFESSKDMLVVYSFMFPRYSKDTRPGPAEGETAQLPLTETPCPSCTSILDALDGAAPHLSQRVNLAVVARRTPTASARSRRSEAGVIFGFSPPATTATTATTRASPRRVSSSRS